MLVRRFGNNEKVFEDTENVLADIVKIHKDIVTKVLNIG